VRDSFMAIGNPWIPDSNAPNSTGVCMLAYNARDNVRVSTNDGYLEPVRQRSNLSIRGGVLVDRVVLSGSRATGVAAIVDGSPIEFHGDEVILSAGAVHSPAMLERSGIGTPALLGRLGIPVRVDLPVGEEFAEHPCVVFRFPVDSDLPGAVNRRHTNTGVRWSSGVDGAPEIDMQALASGPSPADPNFAGMGLLANQSFGRGDLHITSTDPTIDPQINMNLASDERDMKRLRQCVAIAQEIFFQASFDPLKRGDVAGIDGTRLCDLKGDAHTDRWIRRVVDGCAHASATCSIGKVVDSTGRVYGIERLRVIDLSIVPQVPRANTNLTAIMMGEYMASVLQKGD
jgi:choline dehydrogenase-like flavoprotein